MPYSMRTGAHTKMVIGFWDLQLVKEDIRHFRIIVLPGMNEDFGMILPELTGNRGALDKLGSCSDNRDNHHGNFLFVHDD